MIYRFRPTSVFSLLALLCTTALPAFLPGMAMASGFGVPAGTMPSHSRNGIERQSDHVYEHGKAIFLGRQPGASKIDYCVVVDGEAKKLRKRYLKSYKGGSLLEFANSLYNCADTQKLALNSVPRKQVPFVLYYLNKRYKLDLSNS